MNNVHIETNKDVYCIKTSPCPSHDADSQHEIEKEDITQKECENSMCWAVDCSDNCKGESSPVDGGLPSYYDNSKGSLYKIAEQRGWSSYTFDVVKRLDRGGKKDPLKQEIIKSIGVLQLWLKELES